MLSKGHIASGFVATALVLSLAGCAQQTPEVASAVTSGNVFAWSMIAGGDTASSASETTEPSDADAIDQVLESAGDANLASTSGEVSNNSGSANNQGSAPAATPSAPSNSGNSNSGNSNGGASASTPAPAPSQPAHTHNWIAQTTQQYVVDVPAQSKIVCSCGSIFGSTAEWDAHKKALGIGGANGHSYSSQATPEQGHYETITTGYTCSCGATK